MRWFFVASVLVVASSATCSAVLAQAPLSPAEVRLGARLFDSATLGGVVVQQIVPGKAADRAGMKARDVILRFQGGDIRNLANASFVLMEAPGDRPLSVEVLRGTQSKRLVVVLPARGASLSGADATKTKEELQAIEELITTFKGELSDLEADRKALLGQASSPVLGSLPGVQATIVGDDGQNMVLIPGGEFIMGGKEPIRISLDAFYIDQYEVTNEMWDRVAVSKRRPKSLCDRCPVIAVSWYEAKTYCEKVGKRLPTEAEWEKAARGPDGLPYVWGQNFRPGLANVKSAADKFSFTGPIESFALDKSVYGVYNLSGNVSEWVDWWYQKGYYATMPRSNPKGPVRGDFKIYRGGSWKSRQEETRTTAREWSFPEEQHETVGFRCAKDAS